MKSNEIDKTNQEYNPKELPAKAAGNLRLVSYNIVADFFDSKDKTEDGHHHWKFRSPFVIKLLESVYPDIMCLQELSPSQSIELHNYFSSKGYSSVFLCQTPSEVEGGAIARGSKVAEWIGKDVGATLIGTFISGNYKCLKEGRFWLNEEPDSLPKYTDRGITDKGFGNMNTYRAVLWSKIQDCNKELYVFNSHYPLSGNNKTRLECAKVEVAKIKEITKGTGWVSAGDRNCIPTKDDDATYNPATVLEELVKNGNSGSLHDSNNHCGMRDTTWIGFSYDQFKTKIVDGKIENQVNLDVVVSNLPTSCTFTLHGAFNPSTQELLPLGGALSDGLNDGYYFSSDHALVGADLFLG